MSNQKTSVDDYEKCLFEELDYFYRMCSEKEKNFFRNGFEGCSAEEIARLTAVVAVADFRPVFVYIMAQVEGREEEIFAAFDSVRNNFPLAESWLNDFIAKIEEPLFKRVLSDMWQEKRKKLVGKPFEFKMLFHGKDK